MFPMPLLYTFSPRNPCAPYLSFAQRLGTRRESPKTIFPIKKALEKGKQSPPNLGFSLTSQKRSHSGALSAGGNRGDKGETVGTSCRFRPCDRTSREEARCSLCSPRFTLTDGITVDASVADATAHQRRSIIGGDLRSADQVDKLLVRLELRQLRGQLLHRIDRVHGR